MGEYTNGFQIFKNVKGYPGPLCCLSSLRYLASQVQITPMHTGKSFMFTAKDITLKGDYHTGYMMSGMVISTFNDIIILSCHNALTRVDITEVHGVLTQAFLTKALKRKYD